MRQGSRRCARRALRLSAVACRSSARTADPRRRARDARGMKMKYVGSVLALIVAAPALAQANPDQPSKDAEGKPIIVTASRSGDATPIDLLGSSATLIDNQDMQQQQT